MQANEYLDTAYTRAVRRSKTQTDAREIFSKYPFLKDIVGFDRPITAEIVDTAASKIITKSLDRYYILSTSGIEEKHRVSIAEKVASVRLTNGCQIIVNGIYDTIKYYLRLMNNSEDFIQSYVSLLETDLDIKYGQREAWKDLASNPEKLSI